ncbi:ribosome biogenesis GTPase Der [bacterium CG10_46_32]|nr:MAG: ribosome biogenesis GTPase Der [bacterium CG10_46_32]PIR56456.1 MAG: ribosome biogenesis GTPase Der [Parcubacteria group bacterium CG10_big_fil_rev_8_21_14_0_10_46_32]
MKQLSRVVIVGRSNVGKSTLFNAIIEKRHALVTPKAGTTRDVLEAGVVWRGKHFTIIDTGGLDPAKNDTYRDAIIKQSKNAQTKATIILFMVDVTVGILDQDQSIIKDLRKLGIPILLAINKCDNAHRRKLASAFKRFNLPSFEISASNGSGTGDMLDAIVAALPESDIVEKKSDITLALIGKPNAGKSSLLNSIFGEERMIVSVVPHTTRDSQDVTLVYNENTYTVIDTAGIRRKTKNGDDVEVLSINKSMAAIARADVIALVMDISEPLTSQDHRLAREIEDENKGLFIVANKWDKIPEKDSQTVNRYAEYLGDQLPNLSWVPVIFTSAVDNQRTKEILTLALHIKKNLDRTITDNALGKFIKVLIAKRKPTIGKGTRRPRLLSLTQTGANPPSFVMEIPNKTDMAQSYQQFIINSLREKFDFEGVPIKLSVRSREIKKDEEPDLAPQKKRMTHRHRHY